MGSGSVRFGTESSEFFTAARADTDFMKAYTKARQSGTEIDFSQFDYNGDGKISKGEVWFATNRSSDKATFNPVQAAVEFDKNFKTDSKGNYAQHDFLMDNMWGAIATAGIGASEEDHQRILAIAAKHANWATGAIDEAAKTTSEDGVFITKMTNFQAYAKGKVKDGDLATQGNEATSAEAVAKRCKADIKKVRDWCNANGGEKAFVEAMRHASNLSDADLKAMWKLVNKDNLSKADVEQLQTYLKDGFGISDLNVDGLYGDQTGSAVRLLGVAIDRAKIKATKFEVGILDETSPDEQTKSDIRYKVINNLPLSAQEAKYIAQRASTFAQTDAEREMLAAIRAKNGVGLSAEEQAFLRNLAKPVLVRAQNYDEDGQIDTGTITRITATGTAGVK